MNNQQKHINFIDVLLV